MRHEKGYAVVMSAKHNPRTPNGITDFFGPTVSPEECSFLSENICTNEFRLFSNKRAARKAATERRRAFQGRYPTVRVVGMELHVAETWGEWEKLRSFGTYVVAYGEHIKDTRLYGTPWVNGKRVNTAHDSWAGFSYNGARPFTSFGRLVGEEALGTMPELLRQGGGGKVFLIGIKIRWKVR